MAAALQEDMASLLGWLDGAEGVLAIPLQPAEPRHLRDTLGKVQVSATDAPWPPGSHRVVVTSADVIR